MKIGRIAFVLLLVATPLFSIYYKYSILSIPLLPKTLANNWSIQIEIPKSQMANEGTGQVVLPVLQSLPSQNVLQVGIEGAGNYQLEEGSGGEIITLEAVEKAADTILLSADVELFGHNYNGSGDRFDLSVEQREKYLSLGDVSPEIAARINSITEVIFYPDDGDKEKSQKAFYYITEEFIRDSNVSGMENVLSLYQGDARSLGELYRLILRSANIPTREILTFDIPSEGSQRGERGNVGFLTDVYIDGMWLPVDIYNARYGETRNHTVLLHRDTSEISPLFNEGAQYSIFTRPLQVDRRDSSPFLDEITKTSELFSSVSLHNLPLSVQSIFYTILLIPFGAVLLSLSRNIVGVGTFGIFTPVLLSLFFLETSLAFGLLFFSFIVFLGIFQRYILDRMFLLAVPRLSVLLSLVIISYVCLTLFGHQGHFQTFSVGAVNYFPIVIITVFIERFSIHFIEEGALNTFKTLLGTLFVAILCYILFSVEYLNLIVFNHPELILLAIALNLLIGKYKGYRLSEFFRFREFSKQVNA